MFVTVAVNRAELTSAPAGEPCQAEFLLTAETTVLLGFLGWDWVLVVISRMGSFPGAALTPLSVLTLTAGTNWSHFFTTYNVTILRDWFWQGCFFRVWVGGWGRRGLRLIGNTSFWCWRSLSWWGSSRWTAGLSIFFQFLFETDGTKSIFVSCTEEPTAVAAEWGERLLRIGVHVLCAHLNEGTSLDLSLYPASIFSPVSRYCNVLTVQLSCSCKANISDFKMFDFTTAPPDALNATGSVQMMQKSVISL